MTKNQKGPVLVHSIHSQDVLVDGHRFSISIVATDQNRDWCLEIVDDTGTSHVWDNTFRTDTEALEAAMVALHDEGADGFLKPDTNVIPFLNQTPDDRV